MEEQASEEQYLEFVSAGILFLLPVQWIKKVIEEEDGIDQFPVFCVSSGADYRRGAGERSYLILLEKQGRMAAVPAERVIGVKRMDSRRLLKLKEPVLNERNRYLEAAAVMEDTENSMLGLVLNPEVILERIVSEKAEEGQ